VKPNNLKFEDITVGLTEGFKVTITEEMIEQFAGLSGDYNPLHVDKEFAKNTRFKKPIAHGLLVASFVSRLVGMHLPGQHALLLSTDLKYPKPVFAGNELEVTGEVSNKNDNLKIITIKISINNDNNEKCVEGEARVLYLENHE